MTHAEITTDERSIVLLPPFNQLLSALLQTLVDFKWGDPEPMEAVPVVEHNIDREDHGNQRLLPGGTADMEAKLGGPLLLPPAAERDGPGGLPFS